MNEDALIKFPNPATLNILLNIHEFDIGESVKFTWRSSNIVHGTIVDFTDVSQFKNDNFPFILGNNIVGSDQTCILGPAFIFPRSTKTLELEKFYAFKEKDTTDYYRIEEIFLERSNPGNARQRNSFLHPDESSSDDIKLEETGPGPTESLRKNPPCSTESLKGRKLKKILWRARPAASPDLETFNNYLRDTKSYTESNDMFFLRTLTYYIDSASCEENTNFCFRKTPTPTGIKTISYGITTQYLTNYLREYLHNQADYNIILYADTVAEETYCVLVYKMISYKKIEVLAFCADQTARVKSKGLATVILNDVTDTAALLGIELSLEAIYTAVDFYKRNRLRLSRKKSTDPDPNLKHMVSRKTIFHFHPRRSARFKAPKQNRRSTRLSRNFTKVGGTKRRRRRH